MKFLNWISGNILFIVSLFLLAFIPLYPKLPIIDIQNTWVYVRFEDFAVAFAILLWIILFFFKKTTLKTPLTLPILLFWIIGGIATLHGVLLIFPTIANVFSNVAFLSLLRRIEYMSLFFIAYSSIKDKKNIVYISILLAFVLICVVGYGFGQRFLGFPAFLTMNEEFAKGIPIQLSQLSRVPSTFGGQYDLAAYLVLIIPLLVSMAFGFKSFFMKALLLITSFLGFALLFLTVSRISFFVLLLSLLILLIVWKKRLIIICLFIITFVLLSFSPRLLQRFTGTVTEVDVLVDAKTGDVIGQIKEVPASYFENKLVMRQNILDEKIKLATSSSAILPFAFIPPSATLVVETNRPNGETLPQGTSYINIPLSPVDRKISTYFTDKSNGAGAKSDTRVYFGEYVIKKAKAYDLSFTTRFQGEWPKTLLAFKRNIFLGSGYGSVSLAVDNDYLRLLGESGLLGFVSFFSIFLIVGISIKKTLPKIDSPVVKSFVLGFVIGTFGLALNAVFIDVFEASKIAFVYWLLMGITLGVLKMYKSEEIDILKELKKALTSPYTMVIYLFTITFALLSSTMGNYFVGDDFTWFRWAADSGGNIFSYLTQSNGFFYRPGTKLYFDLMYSIFWLNQTIYHFVSLFLHFTVAVLIFFISRRIFKNKFLSIFCASIFLILSGYFEEILWTSSTGNLFNVMFALFALLFYIFWQEKKKRVYLVFSLISIALSLLFHELGVVVPLLIILYNSLYGERPALLSRKLEYLLIAFPLLPYLILRIISNSHWFNGDYSYNIFKLPFNVLGNTVGYLILALFGPLTLSFYERLRLFSKEHLLLAIPASLIVFFLFFQTHRILTKKLGIEEKKIVIFGFLFFIISLLPFLGLGNITSRYSYLASFGFALLFVFFIKKIYDYLLNNGKYIAIASVAVITIIFASNHLFQMQKIQIDWDEAGKKSKNFLNSLNWVYAHYGKENATELYFVNVPIRNKEAWVFPVGLKDAVWLVSRDTNTKVYQAKSVDQAFEEIGNSNGKVFLFDDSGSFIEMKKALNGTFYPVVK